MSYKWQSNKLAVFQTLYIIHWDSGNFISWHNILLLQKNKTRKQNPKENIYQVTLFKKSNNPIYSEMPTFPV